MLSDRGGWATFIGMPRGRNEFYRLYQTAIADPERWFSLLLTADQSGILPQHELADLRKTTSAEKYAQEYECDFAAAIVGAHR
jgi:phage terminase large subunit